MCFQGINFKDLFSKTVLLDNQRFLHSSTPNNDYLIPYNILFTLQHDHYRITGCANARFIIIKQPAQGIKSTDLVEKQVRLSVTGGFALAYNLGNFLRRLALPKKIRGRPFISVKCPFCAFRRLSIIRATE